MLACACFLGTRGRGLGCRRRSALARRRCGALGRCRPVASGAGCGCRRLHQRSGLLPQRWNSHVGRERCEHVQRRVKLASGPRLAKERRNSGVSTEPTKCTQRRWQRRTYGGTAAGCCVGWARRAQTPLKGREHREHQFDMACSRLARDVASTVRRTCSAAAVRGQRTDPRCHIGVHMRGQLRELLLHARHRHVRAHRPTWWGT